MDWSKAKSILILILIALNVFLLSYIISYRLSQNISRETIADARQVLAGRGVVLECEIPLYNRDTPKLVYQNGDFDRLKIAKRLVGDVTDIPETETAEVILGSKRLVFDNRNSFEFWDKNPSDKLDIAEKDNVEKYLREVMNELGFSVSNFKLEVFTKNPDGSRTFSFTERYKNFLVFDNRIEFVVSDKGIKYINCSYRKIKGFSSGQKSKVMPAYKVLLKNFNTSENTTIVHIDIGFKGYSPQQDMVEYFEGPAWRITFKDGTVRYFRASDGEEIK